MIKMFKEKKKKRVLLYKDFPGSPVIKTLPSNAGCAGSIPGTATKIPHASWPKNQSMKQNNIVTNSVKTLKMVHIGKTFKKKSNNLCNEVLIL